MEVEAGAGTDAVRAGRRYAEAEALALGALDLVDDVRVVASELIANALIHGLPPVTVEVRPIASGLRVEVADARSQAPLLLTPSTVNMTGRGLAMVAALATRWGVSRPADPTRGKVVWAEFQAGADTPDPPREGDAFAAWDDEVPLAAGRYRVVLGDVPTELLLEAKAHIDNLVREFTLTRANAEGRFIPPQLESLIRTVVDDFAEARDAIKRQAVQAARRGEPRTALALHLPLDAAEAGERYLTALDEADAYARAARLLTLESPPVHRLFRRWYVEALITQLRDLGAGRAPSPVVPFEKRMMEEISRLAALQRVSDRAARLQRVSQALASTETPEDVAAVVVVEGVAALEASGGGMLLPAKDGLHMAVPGVVGYPPDLVDALREERLDAPLPAATAVRTGEPVWLESREERDWKFPALRGLEAETISMCAVPLTAAGRVLGALRFSFESQRLFDADERGFVTALAAQTAQTLLRTEAYAAEREASLGLQRALLPQHIPAVEGWDVAASYSPAGAQEAGGDFYDVIRLSDDRLVAVVGDVMGRGIDAAAAMAQVRTMIRAYAIDDPDPRSVFSKVDSFFRLTDTDQLVTVLYLLIDSRTGEVTVGNAGHLPPLCLIEGRVEECAKEVGTPFGVEAEPRITESFELPKGARIVVVTDGLVERRGEDIEEGLGRLHRQVASVPAHADAQQTLDHIVQGSSNPGPDEDDTTVLVLARKEG